jgi:predicted kinase
MRGTPCSGKSTFVNNNFSDGIICSADHFMMTEDGKYNFAFEKLQPAHNACFDKFVKALHNKEPLIVIDNTNVKSAHMKTYVNAAKQHEYNIRIIRVVTPLEVVKTRDNGHNVPFETVQRMFEQMEEIPDSWSIKEIIVNGQI